MQILPFPLEFSSVIERAVVMTVSGERPEYLRQTLNSWSVVDGRDGWAFGFAIEPGDRADECRRMIQLWLADREGFILLNPERLGVLRNPHAVLDEGFASYRFVVLAEEDIEVSNDVLRYFEYCDRQFVDNVHVLTVCASSWDDPGGDPAGLHVEQYFASGVWASWRDRWVSTLRDTWDLDYSTGEGHSAGWDWNILRIMCRLEVNGVWPHVSRSLHIGEHGEHSCEGNFENSQAKSFVPTHVEDYWTARVV